MSAQPRTITQKLADLPNKVAADRNGFGQQLSDAAVAAVFNGLHSPEWETYMKIIVGPSAPKQLARLKLDPADPLTNNPDVKKSAAYIVANAICAPTTTGQTGNGTKTAIDDDGDGNLLAEP